MAHRYIFVAGLHRSGTSILFKCLRDHPMVSGFKGTDVPEDEGQHLQSVYPPAHLLGGSKMFGFHPQGHLTENSPLVTDTNRDRLSAEWHRYWDMSKPYLLEKSPPNLIRTRFLQAMFPESYFVVITRHPIAYAFPRQGTTTPRTVYNLVRHWVTCHGHFREDRKHLRNVLVMKYEDFVARPAESLRSIFSFAGLPDHPTEQQVRSDINRKYFEGWRNDRERLPSGLWLGYTTMRFERSIQQFGYSLRDPYAMNA
jgi:hypothetical protein